MPPESLSCYCRLSKSAYRQNIAPLGYRTNQILCPELQNADSIAYRNLSVAVDIRIILRRIIQHCILSCQAVCTIL